MSNKDAEQPTSFNLEEALARGLADADAGRVTPLEEAFQRLRDRLKQTYDDGKASGAGRSVDPEASMSGLRDSEAEEGR